MMNKRLATHLNFRLTPQRMAILEFLEGNTSHPSAEDIFRAVKKRYPTISFATIYNTLDKLERVAAVQELKIGASRKRYDPNTTNHHHLVCRSCGKIVDIHADYRLEVPAQVSAAFEVAGNHVEFSGVCHPCRERESRMSGCLSTDETSNNTGEGGR